MMVEQIYYDFFTGSSYYMDDFLVAPDLNYWSCPTLHDGKWAFDQYSHVILQSGHFEGYYCTA